MLYAPAQGKIIGIQRDIEGYIRVSIFLRLWDNHTQLAPCEGTLITTQHRPGRFHAAYLLQKSEYNELQRSVFETQYGRVLIEQISGIFARRIRFDITPGQKVAAKERIGEILLGSRVNITFPDSLSVRVKNGDFVKAGETVIAISKESN